MRMCITIKGNETDVAHFLKAAESLELDASIDNTGDGPHFRYGASVVAETVEEVRSMLASVGPRVAEHLEVAWEGFDVPICFAISLLQDESVLFDGILIPTHLINSFIANPEVLVYASPKCIATKPDNKHLGQWACITSKSFKPYPSQTWINALDIVSDKLPECSLPPKVYETFANADRNIMEVDILRALTAMGRYDSIMAKGIALARSAIEIIWNS